MMHVHFPTLMNPEINAKVHLSTDYNNLHCLTQPCKDGIDLNRDEEQRNLENSRLLHKQVMYKCKKYEAGSLNPYCFFHVHRFCTFDRTGLIYAKININLCIKYFTLLPALCSRPVFHLRPMSVKRFCTDRVTSVAAWASGEKGLP
jgi:hypothetical protein